MAKKLIISLASNGFSVVSRLAAGVLIFIGLGRILPAQDFGLFSFWVGAATILGVAGDFGSSTKILHDLPAARDNGSAIFSKLFNLRLRISALLICLAMPIVLFWFRSESIVAIVMILAMFVVTAGEFYSNALRALGKFEVESRISSINNLLTAVVVIAAATQGLLPAIIANLLIRSFGTWKLLQATRTYGLTWHSRGLIWADIQQSFSFAADSMVTILASGFDVLVVRQVGGLNAVASYQAVSKLVTGFFVFAQVFSGVFIPRIVRSEKKQRELTILLGVFVIFSVAFAIFLNLMSGFVADVLYKGKYFGVEHLVFTFSLYLIVRFCASAFGIFLTAIGKQSVRVVGNIISLLITIPLALYVGRRWGSDAIPYCLAIGAGLLSLVYMWTSWKALVVQKSHQVNL